MIAQAPEAATTDRSFGLVKFVSWGTLVLLLLSSLFLGVFLANYSKQILLTKQQEYAQLLSQTLNHLIFRRFVLPTALEFGEVDLADAEQYKRLDGVVQESLKDFPLLDLRMYDPQHVVVFALEKALAGQKDLAGEAVVQALESGKNTYEILYQTGILGGLFAARLDPGSVVMRTTSPLRAQIGQKDIIGVLEFSMDITSDYEKLLTFQRIIILVALATNLVVFFILRMLIHRADRINAQRQGEREVYERELVQHEKLVSMGRMVAGIAHEIRNPLGIIRSSAELLTTRLKDKDALTARILTAIHEESVRLSKTVGDFLDYARPRQPKLDPVDLAQVLEQALGFLEQKCREQGVEVVRDFSPGLMVKGDKDLLYRALYNILVNALEAMVDQGEGAKAAECREEGDDEGFAVRGQIVIQGGVERGAAWLTIMDTGPGFSPEVKDKLLDPFFTTKDTGTGLGLAIVANILKSHGASIALDTNPHGGARVDMRFAKP